MRHLEASNLLTHYLAGDLRPERRQEVEKHVAECQDCARWVATYSLFSAALAEHPPSHELARFSLAPETLDAASHERCARHLEGCGECREQSEVVRQAAAGEPEPALARKPARIRPRRRAWVALAASVILALGASLMFRTTNRSAGEQGSLGGGQVRMLTDSTLTGEKTILADRSIVVATTEVASGGALTLESEVVSFGDGFSVMSGGTLAVVTSKSIEEEDSSSSSG